MIITNFISPNIFVLDLNSFFIQSYGVIIVPFKPVTIHLASSLVVIL